MNAKELADALDDVVANYIQMIADVDFSDVATMLRQQQAEINTLRNHGYKTQYELLRIEFLQQQAEIDRLTMLCDCMTTESNRKGNEIEELKAHPVKELTDEEIEIEWFKVFKPETGIGKNLTNGVYEFALAILRKAQEK